MTGWTPTYTTWNPSDKATGITLSSGNRVSAAAVSNLGSANVRSVISKATGHWYWEISTGVRTNCVRQFGVANSSFVLTTQLNVTNAQVVVATLSDSTTFGILLDLDAKTLSCVQNGVGTIYGPADISSLTGPLFACIGATSNNSSVAGSVTDTANFGASAFVMTIPTGYAPLYS